MLQEYWYKCNSSGLDVVMRERSRARSAGGPPHAAARGCQYQLLHRASLVCASACNIADDVLLTLVPVRMSGGLFVSAVGADTSEWEGFLRIVYVCLWTRRWVCDTFVEIWINKYVNTAREHVYRHTHSHAHSVCSCTFAHKAKHTSTRAHSLTKLHNDKHTCTQTQTRVCARMMTYLRITLCHSMAVHLLHTYTRQEKT